MKKFCFCLVLGLISIAQSLNAQVDFKVNPVGFILGRATAGLEVGVKPNFGIETTGSMNFYNITFNKGDEDEVKLRNRTYRVMLNGRYYFNPQKGLDRFYLGAYGRYTGGTLLGTDTDVNEKVNQNRLAVGMLIGTKVVSRNQRLVFDFNVGIGRTIFNEYSTNDSSIDLMNIPLFKIDFPVAISLGYRFGGGSKSKG